VGHAEVSTASHRLSLEMEVSRPHFIHHNAFCNRHSHSSPIPEAGICGCLVRFHGQLFPIKDRKARIIFTFRKTADGCEELQKYKYVDEYAFCFGIRPEMAMNRIRVTLVSSDWPHIAFEEHILLYTFVVLPSAEKLRSEAAPVMPAHVARILSSHAISGAIFMLKGRLSLFGRALAETTGMDCHTLLALSPCKYLEIIHHLSSAQRERLLHNFQNGIQSYGPLVQKSSKRLEEKCHIARLIATLQGSIFYLPVELLTEIFLISVEQLRVTRGTLQQVCRTWRCLVARLWGAFQVGTWTNIQSAEMVVNQGPRSLDIVIDTLVDEPFSIISEKPYAALALAWISAPRWRSLTINSFPSNAMILVSNVLFYPHFPFKNLRSLFVGSGCDSSDYINKIMEVIASTATSKLTNLTFAATAVFQQLNQLDWVRVYSQLTFLEVKITNTREPVDILRHCARLEVLKLSGVVSPDLSPVDELPLIRTLRQLWLKRASIQWMSGRVFKLLESCTLLRPVDPHTINQASITSLPLCTKIILQSHLVRILAAFHLPVVNKVIIQCNQWSKAHTNLELSRVWSQSWNPGILQPKILSLKLLCGNQPLLGALHQMVSLEELSIELPRPSALGVDFFEALCAVSVDKMSTREARLRWPNGKDEWQVKICPSLVKLQLQYERWLREGEVDVVTPLFVAVAWSWGRMPSPLRQFNLKLGGGGPLQLVGMTHLDRAFVSLWRHSRLGLDHHTLRDPPEQMLYIGSITSAINRSIGCTNGNYAFPFRCLGQQYYTSFFRYLRAFHHHAASHPEHSYNVLPFFEHLEELDVSNFRFEPCPPTVCLPLCRTLRFLHIRNTPLNWMDGRIFKRVIECRIVVCEDEHIDKLWRVEIPACRDIEFTGSKYMAILASFHLSSIDSLLLELSQEDESQSGLGMLQDIVLLTRFIRPRVLQIRKEPKDKNFVTTLQANIGGGVVVEPAGGRAMDFLASEGMITEEELEESEGEEYSQ